MGQLSKLRSVDGRLGATTGGQQTTRTVFDTIARTSLTFTNLEFFKTFQGKTPGQTNLTQNKLDSSESMVVKSISIFQIGSNGAVAFPALGAQMLLNFYVGNQRVIKNLPISFNNGETGQPYDRLHANSGVQSTNPALAVATQALMMPTEIRLITDIVIPPQVEFYVTLSSSSTGSSSNSAMVCALTGYGKIFSAGNSF